MIQSKTAKYPQARRNYHEWRKNGKLYAEHGGSCDGGQECDSARFALFDNLVHGGSLTFSFSRYIVIDTQ
jgi:hypothetical protein